MSEMYRDTCNGCEQVYFLLPHDDDYKLTVYLSDHECNSIVAKCPKCGFVTRIFTDPESVIELISFGLKLSIYAEAPDDVKDGIIEANLTQSELRQEQYEEWEIENAPDDEIKRELGML